MLLLAGIYPVPFYVKITVNCDAVNPESETKFYFFIYFQILKTDAAAAQAMRSR